MDRCGSSRGDGAETAFLLFLLEPPASTDLCESAPCVRLMTSVLLQPDLLGALPNAANHRSQTGTGAEAAGACRSSAVAPPPDVDDLL